MNDAWICKSNRRCIVMGPNKMEALEKATDEGYISQKAAAILSPIEDPSEVKLGEAGQFDTLGEFIEENPDFTGVVTAS